MDLATAEVLKTFGINSQTVPSGFVRLLSLQELQALGERSSRWVRKEENSQALAYAVDNEHQSPVGLALRNLFFDARKDHLLITQAPGPYWCGWHHSLPHMYQSGVGVLVEGPKDALVLISQGIPAAAFLGVTPTHAHLRAVARYLRGAIWIRDSDLPDFHGERRAEQVRKQARELNLILIELPIPVKDPAELVKCPAYFEVIKHRVWEISRFL